MPNGPEANKREGKRSERKGGLTRQKAEGAARQHRPGQAIHDGLSLDMKIAVELIREPPPDQANTIPIDAGAEEGHGPTRPGGTGGDIGRRVCGIGIEREGGPDATSEVGRLKILKGATRRGGVRAERGRRRGMEGAQCNGAGYQGESWAQSGMAGAAVSDGFVTNPILLPRESERGGSSGV